MSQDPVAKDNLGSLYADIFNNAPIGIYTINQEGKVDSFNPKMLEISGAKSVTEVLGLNALTLPTYKKFGLVKYFKEGLAGKPFTLENVEYVSYTGGKRSVRRYTGIPIRNEAGEVTRLLLMVEDVTESDRLLRELQESEERFRVIFETANDGIFTLSPEGFFTSANQKAQAMTGYRLEEVVGKHFATVGVIAAKDIPRTLKEFAKRLAGILSAPYEVTLVRKGGQTLEVEINSAFIKKDGKIVETMGIIRDVTERKRLTEMRLEFVAIASHQLLDPLGMTRGAIFAILAGETGPIGAETRTYLEQILEKVERQILIVSNFLSVSSLEAGKMLFEIKAVEIEEVLARSLSEFQAAAERKGLTLERTEPEKSFKVKADPLKLAVIVDNLISNALKYTKIGGVKVSVRTGGNRAELVVSDTGLGLEAENQVHLFEKFYRSHGEVRGTGLGLYLCKMLAEKMGAEIRLEESLPGRGSTFVVSLPLAE